MYKWIDSNVQWMNIFTSIFSWFHIILNVNFEFKSSIQIFFFKTELSNIIFSKKKIIIFQENAKMLK